MKQVCDGSIGGNNLGKHEVCCREGEIILPTRFPAETNSGGLCHVILGTKFRVGHVATQTLLMCCFCQEARYTEHVNHQLPRQLARCVIVSSLSRSGRGRRVVVGRQTTAFAVSCDTPERPHLNSSLHLPQSSGTAHSIDAGSTLTRLVMPLSPKMSVVVLNIFAAAR